MPPTPPRQRGAPKGNTNSLKHGFYSHRLKSADRTALTQCADSGLKEEINLLRLQIRRVVELSTGIDDLATSVNLLRILSLACLSLNRMIHTQAVDFSTANQNQILFDKALGDIMEEIGYNKPRPS